MKYNLKKIFILCILCASAVNIGYGDKYLDDLAESLHSPDESKVCVALEQLVKYQSSTPSLQGIKLLFSLASSPSTAIQESLDKSIPRLKITDEIIRWFEDDAISSPNSLIRLLALRIIGANLTEEYPGTITSLNLLNKFIYDPEEQIRIETIKYLSQINDTATIPLLSISINDGSYMVRNLVLDAFKKYLYSPVVLDILLKKYPSESSLTLQFKMEEVIISTVDNCISGTDIMLSSLKSESPEIRALACRVIGKSLLIRNANPDEKEKYIKALIDFQSNDENEDVLASIIWSLRKLYASPFGIASSSLWQYLDSALKFNDKTIVGLQYPISTRLLALDSFSSSREIFGDSLKPLLESVKSDWRLKSYWYSLMAKSIPMGIGTPFRYRVEPLKTEALLKYGGGKETESAVEMGLKYLMRTQEKDGSWNCAKYNPWHDKSPLPFFTNEDELVDVSVTGLNILCFLGSGSTHKYGPYQQVIMKGLEYIRSAQDKTGVINIPKGHVHTERCLVQGEDHGILPRRYNHNISTLVLVETYAMTGDEIIKDAAQRALEHSRNTPEPGFPWSFYLEKTDVGPSIFYILALKIAQQTDLIVSPKEIENVKIYLDRLTDKASGRIIHICPIPICFGGMDSTATGLFANILMKADNPMNTKTADWLKKYPPVWAPFYQFNQIYPNLLFLEENIVNEWQWYYQTLAFRQIGGDYWNKWNEKHKEILLKYQRKGGLLDGSWDPEGPWATVGGRLYSTAFSILSLQAYYSYSFPP
ncbi:MAG: HEAT repeat domain-containing protein [Planctomycetota bacterium]